MIDRLEEILAAVSELAPAEENELPGILGPTWYGPFVLPVEDRTLTGWAGAPVPAAPEDRALPAEPAGVVTPWAAMAHTAGPEGEEHTGLRVLYRRAGEALRAPLSGGPSPRLTAAEQPPAVPAGLSVRGMDRAVERDSRRYDGGMSIY